MEKNVTNKQFANDLIRDRRINATKDNNKSFINFCLEKRKLNKKWIVEAISASYNSRTIMGNLAIELGYLTQEQMDEVILEQQRSHNKYFGSLAVEMGYLESEDVVSELLSIQRERFISEEEYLLNKDFLTRDTLVELEYEYRAFLLELEKVEDELSELNDLDAILDKIFMNFKADDVIMLRPFVKLLVSRLQADIDSETRPMGCKTVEEFACDFFVTQKIVTDEIQDIELDCGISGKFPTLLQMASIYAEEPINEVEDMVDALGEYINRNNGAFLAILDEFGVKADLLPQTLISKSVVQKKKTLYIVPCNTKYGDIDIVFSL